jgi:hypothetical protein
MGEGSNNVAESEPGHNSVRARYWRARATASLLGALLRRGNRRLAGKAFRDQVRFLTGRVRPVPGETRDRAKSAVDWLLRAHDATGHRGVSYGYFPCDERAENGWRPAYPETTGYIIPTLLECASRFQRPDLKERALAMARWEIEVQMPSGAVQGGPVCPPEQQVAAVFNTGMVLHGYTAAVRESRDPAFLEAGRRAADFLVADIGEDGHFHTHGAHVTAARVKTYNCLCAWALYRSGQDTGEARYIDAAVRAADAALGQQRENGWFANNCLDQPEAPLLHTIGYTLQGVLEVGILSGKERFVAAARRGCEPLLPHIDKHGRIRSRFRADWTADTLSSCLTGNAQLAVICYRLHEVTGERAFLDAATRLLDWLKALQDLDSKDPGIRGAIGGSFPLLGDYMPAGYPNWATKYFLDALLAQDRTEGGR